MSDYMPIARAYMSKKLVAVWCVLLMCLLSISTFEGEFARGQSEFLGGILSKKSYMAMFTYFNACLLGVFLGDNMAHPWASLLPNYRQKHLVVATLITFLFLAVPLVLVSFVGISDVALSSVFVIFLTCLAAGLWTTHHLALGGILALPFLAFVLVPSSSSPALGAFLAGTTPATSLALLCLTAVALWVLARRLLSLNEESLSYAGTRNLGGILRGQSHAFGGHVTAFANSLVLPANQRVQLPKFDNLKRIDELAQYSAGNLWQRLRLWRIGTAPSRTSVSVIWLMVFTLIIIPAMIFLQRSAGAENSARDVVVIFSVQVMTNPFVVWLFWINRRQRLGYESLRPRTRQAFIRELGLTLFLDLVQCWLGGVAIMVIAATIWAPELLQASNMILFVFCTGMGQLCSFAMMGFGLLKFIKGSVLASIACAFGPFFVMETWILFVVMQGNVGYAANMVIAFALATASVAMMPSIYRRWCHADLD